MDIVLLLAILVLVGVVAVAVLRPRGTASPPELPAPPSLEVLRTELAAQQQADLERLRGDVRSTLADLDDELQRLRAGIRDAQLEQASLAGDLRDRLALAEAQPGSDPAPDGGRRGEVIAELDQRLAKLEIACASVLNPLLLPGEPLLLPAELPPSASRWEGWKEIGDAAFGFAEEFSAGRIHLDANLADSLTEVVSALRGHLTNGIYPIVGAASSGGGDTSALRIHVAQFIGEVAGARRLLRVAYDA